MEQLGSERTNELLVFALVYCPRMYPGCELLLEVMDYDFIGFDDFLGRVKFSGEALLGIAASASASARVGGGRGGRRARVLRAPAPAGRAGESAEDYGGDRIGVLRLAGG